MANSLPPLTWFRAFEVAARHLNFTSAAEELNVTQSAVSQHVRALEQRFGVQLFERKARGLALTKSGRQLLPYVSGAVEELSKATKMFCRIPTGKTSRSPALRVSQFFGCFRGFMDFGRHGPKRRSIF